MERSHRHRKAERLVIVPQITYEFQVTVYCMQIEIFRTDFFIQRQVGQFPGCTESDLSGASGNSHPKGAFKEILQIKYEIIGFGSHHFIKFPKFS